MGGVKGEESKKGGNAKRRQREGKKQLGLRNHSLNCSKKIGNPAKALNQITNKTQLFVVDSKFSGPDYHHKISNGGYWKSIDKSCLTFSA